MQWGRRPPRREGFAASTRAGRGSPRAEHSSNVHDLVRCSRQLCGALTVSRPAYGGGAGRGRISLRSRCWEVADVSVTRPLALWFQSAGI